MHRTRNQGYGRLAEASGSSTSSGVHVHGSSIESYNNPEVANEVVYRTGGTVSRHRRDLPWGIRLIQKLSDCCCSSPSRQVNRDMWYRVSILILTYMCYTSYHLSRKPISIVKNVLNQNCSNVPVPSGSTVDPKDPNWCDWAPFNANNADTLLGTLDSAFLFAYAIGMFFSGFIAERVNLRYFLSLGMLLSGFFTYLFGLAYARGVHNLSYFILVQALAGLFQTTGWPGVVTVMGNWFGKGKRGLIFGLWNSHTSLGNILGSVIAATFVEDDWGLSFIVPGAIIGGMGFVIFLFLVPKPQHVGCTNLDHESGPAASTNANARRKIHRNYTNESLGVGTSISTSGEGYSGSYSDSDSTDQEEYRNPSEDTPMISQIEQPEVKVRAVGFMDALKIPGVVEYSLCLFFAKLVSYTFLYWLPRYINASSANSYSPTESANLSTLFDVGGILGGIIAGVISDYSGMSATTCAGMLIAAVPMLFLYEHNGGGDIATTAIFLILVGLLVNGPYTLITTAVSTDLGTHSCLKGNARALATVTAIIDGTGSVGAAVGPLLAGLLSTLGWKYVFLMLIAADIIALFLLIRLMSHEIKRLIERRYQVTTQADYQTTLP